MDSKSSTKLAEELVHQGFAVSSRTVLRLLHGLRYSLPANAKVTEGRQHPDRDGQFRYLNDLAQDFIDDDQPVISVDTKKKELIGDYANGGTEWSPQGEPELISATATSTGLTIQAGHDPNWYPTGVKITDAELAAVPLHPHTFHGEWNYTITAQSDQA